MKKQTRENPEELFGKFFSEQEAKEAAVQLKKIEQVLQDNPAPEPDMELIADINRQIVVSLQKQSQRYYRYQIYKVATAAAVVIILTIFSIRQFVVNNQVKSTTLADSTVIVPEEVWNSEDITEDDADLLTLTSEIEQTEKEVLAMKFDETTANGTNGLTEIEMELIEIDNDFWKG